MTLFLDCSGLIIYLGEKTVALSSYLLWENLLFCYKLNQLLRISEEGEEWSNKLLLITLKKGVWLIKGSLWW